MKKLNKKGFTLVELLAVIVILALLIVVVANTALPALNNAKKSSLEVYTGRVVEKAKELCMSAALGNSIDTSIGSVDSSGKCTLNVSELMGETATNPQYVGTVTAKPNGDVYTVGGCVRDSKNKLTVKAENLDGAKTSSTDDTSCTG